MSIDLSPTYEPLTAICRLSYVACLCLRTIWQTSKRAIGQYTVPKRLISACVKDISYNIYILLYPLWTVALSRLDHVKVWADVRKLCLANKMNLFSITTWISVNGNACVPLCTRIQKLHRVLWLNFVLCCSHRCRFQAVCKTKSRLRLSPLQTRDSGKHTKPYSSGLKFPLISYSICCFRVSFISRIYLKWMLSGGRQHMGLANKDHSMKRRQETRLYGFIKWPRNWIDHKPDTRHNEAVEIGFHQRMADRDLNSTIIVSE
jgi:hypothetical protein